MNHLTRSPKRRCPQCGREVSWDDNQSRPFCSEKCRLIDLGCWADGEYRIVGEKVDPDTLGRGADDWDPDRFNQ